jgi:hypothetical protein
VLVADGHHLAESRAAAARSRLDWLRS